MKYNIHSLKMAYDMNPYMGLDDFLYFWGHQEPYGIVTKACLSQWYPCSFYVDGIYYNCAEQYMMAEKARIFGDESARQKILAATDPLKMKKLGRQVKNFDAKIWDNVAPVIVVRGNLAKFGQNPSLLNFLLSTGSKTLVEASPYDTIWGIGMTEAQAQNSYPHIWCGTNKLGFSLMDVRDELRTIKENQ